MLARSTHPTGDSRVLSGRKGTGLMLAAVAVLPLLLLVGSVAWIYTSRDPVRLGPCTVLGPACRDNVIPVLASPTGGASAAPWSVSGTPAGRVSAVTTWTYARAASAPAALRLTGGLPAGQRPGMMIVAQVGTAQPSYVLFGSPVWQGGGVTILGL